MAMRRTGADPDGSRSGRNANRPTNRATSTKLVQKCRYDYRLGHSLSPARTRMDETRTMSPTSAHESRLLDLSPDLLGAAGLDGSMKLLNPAWSKMPGWTDEKLRSTPYLEFIHAEDREQTRAAVERMAAGEKVDTFTCRVQCWDGTARCILWSGQPSTEDGCFYVAGKDITDRRQLENELAERAERLERINT